MDEIDNKIDSLLGGGENPNGAADTAPLASSSAPLDNIQPVNPRDPVDMAIDGYFDQRESELKASMLAAQQANPDIQAEVLRAATLAGDPPDAMLAQPQEALEHYKQQDALARLAERPVTKDWMTDPRSSSLAFDDVVPLTDIERAVQEYGYVRSAPWDAFLPTGAREAVNVGRSIAAAPATVSEGLWGVAQMGAETLGGEGSAFAAGLARKRRDAEATAQFLRSDANFWGPTEGMIYGGVESGAASLIAAASGQPELALGVLAAGSTGQAYGQARDAGLPVGQAAMYAGQTGTVEYLTEKLPTEGLFRAIRGNTPFLQMIGQQLVTENIGEQVATHWQDYLTWQALEPTKSFGDYIAERPDAALQTAVATTAGTLLQTGAVKATTMVGQRLAEIDRTTATANGLQRVMDFAKTSALRERAPEQFSELVQKMADAGNAPDVFISAEAFAQNVPPEVLEAMPTVKRQLAEALAMDSDIRLPVGEFVTAVAGTPLEQKLMPHITSSPGDVSLAQTEEFAKTDFAGLREEIDDALMQDANGASFAASADKVFQTVIGDLESTKRFSPDVNKSYAALTRDFFTTLAGRLGITPEEAYQRYPLRTVSAVQTGARLDQPAIINSPEFQAWFGESKVTDSDGTPKILYHGTDADFTAFDKDKTGSNFGLDNVGFFFTSDPDTANRSRASHPKKSKFGMSEAEQAAANAGQTLPVYIKIDNPLTPSKVPGWQSSMGTSAVNLYDLNRDAIEAELKTGKYDGFVMKAEGKELVVPLEPTQIKSAIGNNGQFDPNNPSILEQQARGNVVNFPARIIEKAYPDGWEASTTISVDDIGDQDGVIITRKVGDDIQYATTGGEYGSSEEPYPIGIVRKVDGGYKGIAVTDSFNDTDIPTYFEETKAQPTVEEAERDLVVGAFEINASSKDADTYLRDVADQGEMARSVDDVPPLSFYQENGISAETRKYHKAMFDRAKPGILNLPLPGNRVMQITKRGVSLQLNQTARGTFTPSSNTIALLKDADLSTYLHELGHFFLEVYTHVASQPGVPESVGKDMQALLDWFGVKTLADWNAQSLDEKRDNHEKFARGFEKYLFSGEAPNTEIQSLFQKFAAWLRAVYRNMAALNVSLTKEVRDVMDRMIATDMQIEIAEQVRNYRPLFESAEAMGATSEEFATYQELGDKATNDAKAELERRSLKDMKWLADAKAKALVALQKDARVKRKVVEAEVIDEVSRIPVYAAELFMRHGVLPEDQELNKKQRRKLDEAALENVNHTKMSAEALTEMYADGAPTFDTGKRGMVAKKGGVHPDVIADLFGFKSGDEMVNALIKAEPMGSVVEGITDQRMLERYGDITNPEVQERAAEEAVHNEARGRFVAAELKALQASNRAMAPEGTDKNGRSMSVNLIVKAAKQVARELIGRTRIMDLYPAKYRAAEIKSAKTAAAAFAKGDLKLAAAGKRQQFLSHYGVKEAHEAERMIERNRNYLNKFNKPEVRKKISVEQRDQIDQLLERFDLRISTSRRDIARRESLAEWIERQREEGIEPPLDPRLVATTEKKSYKELTVDEFKALADGVKVIDHLGRLKQELLTAKDQRGFNKARDEMVNSIFTHNTGDLKELRTRNTWGAHAKSMALGFFAMHRKMASLLYEMDGFKTGGPLWEYLVRPMNTAGTNEARMREKATIDLMKIMKPLLNGEKMGGKGKRMTLPSGATVWLNREEQLAVALNMGNAGNWQRMRDGGIGDSGKLTDEDLVAITDDLSEQDWKIVQKIWDYFATFRPEIAAKERRVNGLEPEWIDPTPVSTKYGELPGGYYPIKYDPKASIQAQEHADADKARQQLQGAYTSATTRRSFTKSRAASVSGRPLMLNFAGVYQGVNEIIHDLAWHEWLIDANRILRNPMIDKAMRQNYGAESVAQIKKAVQDIATGEEGPQNDVERIVNHLRQGATIAGLGWNVMTSLMQPLGLTQSVSKIGGVWVMRGMTTWLKDPRGTISDIYAKSDFMRLRGKTFQREINEVQNTVSGKGAVRTALDLSAFYLIAKGQVLADVPTWQGAYEKAIAHGETEERAVDLADQAVIDSQGDGMVHNLAGVQRGSTWQKLFTNFYSYFSTSYNLAVERTKATAAKPTPAAVAELAADYLLLMVMPAVLGSLVKIGANAISGGEPPEPEEIAKKLAEDQVSYLLGMMIGLREIGAAVQGFRGYQGPAGTRFFSELGNAVKQTGQGDIDVAAFKAFNNLMGIMLHYPSGQVGRTVEGAAAVFEGKANPLALVFGKPR